MYLVSYEPEDAYEPRSVTLDGKVSCGDRDDYVWAKVDPPFASSDFQLGYECSTVLLAARFEGESINDIEKWPLHVYVCEAKGGESDSAHVYVNDLKILNWGLLYNSLEGIKK